MSKILNLKISGHIVAKLDSNGSSLIVYDGHNDITPAWDNILRRCLGGQPTAFITKIGAYKNNVALAQQSISQINYLAQSNEVEFIAVFSESSFNDTLDELRLQSDIASFSTKDSLSIEKDSASKLSINWKLTLNLHN